MGNTKSLDSEPKGPVGGQTSTENVALDPRNNMPAVPEQDQHPAQKAKLSTIRNYSTIPKANTNDSDDSSIPQCTAGVNATGSGSGESSQSGGGCPVDHSSAKTDAKQEDESVWVYPSEQMFYNAMRRKRYSVYEGDVKTIVSIHNAVNEMCWMKILEWESLHKKECPEPKLVKFEGRAKDKTIKALWNEYVMGYKPPFDRHDWTVDRNGKQVRYIIDFYGGGMGGSSDSSANGKSADASTSTSTSTSTSKGKGLASFYLDVRPAPTVGGVVDRIRRALYPDSVEIFSDKGVTAGVEPHNMKKD
ncbi:putative cytochrome c-type heme lyase [Zancudomyces culisetae]|uniref:Holocytochrome c-type synthase n=1 Tax=Zancudomyces culisetae TaxID=1213189 RepID=A0A1R1PNA2_ZANCU|nr:putative cytochrome c-type heme lyase [Zancudomyces culisetae]OMH85224.1 putative cytochrome c-type heme lyase [Zancudomyces culisetae]|eukprot:OMH82438.1 putative cytochrome c-type heme lyase [Zancudomyces culisetae]